MSSDDKTFADALAMTARKRARLAHELLHSLDSHDSRTEAEWKAELQKRVERIERDGFEGRPWAEVRAELERDLES